ncbi:response regulator receiver sensor signal transduction histidine kinase [Candidatus Moduliflexus flocculans]|uniref:histidine kinase n=1 Tax=Candidatus Moduliflexus flocculans TaxID=1499966 RepID=A0A081BSU5_9BACT|nr:response regulator receiver sensor signal transduction histidine kinase [Candidatus Moduliflexus flocculans]
MGERVIFCVDDEDIVLKSLKRELKKEFGDDFVVETAENGQDALELFEELLADQSDIPVMISDHIMPDMKGDELLRRIHELSPKTLKIMLTGQADLLAVTNAINHASLYRYIAKPWEATDLILTVKEAILKYDHERQLAEQNRLLHNMNAILEEQVKKRTAELEAQKQALALANASKDKFFSIIAHDLRTPFNGLIGMTQLFSENIEAYSLDDLKKGFEALQKTSKTVYELLENLLTWSRLQRGAIDYFPQEISPHRVAGTAIALFQANMEHKQIAIFNNLSPTVMVYADLNMINTVFRNLLSNALKFTPTGGAIHLSERENNEYIEIMVSDTGIGMKPEELEKLFRIDVKFIRVGTSGEKGTGLGLVLCKELVAQNHGNLWAESEAGKGTTFRFTLPKPPF